ncbi:unnamed protein product [Cyclocybe aegerita]|uniref:Uncharacterized protein n=1 Tax=Cyclocybe aegerita TaxID=1973307 RepID=A0A8S0WJ71_CYCAE|nr:unnamed protein product [Cyclocybe aegerita]
MDDGVQTSSTSRRRTRESETESQKSKREKAAERQRRKRERDRRNAAALQAQQQQAQQQAAAVAVQQQQQAQQQLQQPPPPPPPQPQQAPPQQAAQAEYSQQELTAEEIIRRDRVRAAARERQRKHRLLVKQRRMRELGLDMGNEIIPGMEEVHYRAAPDGQYHQVLPPELQQQLPQPPPPPAHHPGQPPVHEPPFPQGAPLGGQTFASTLLLSFSCAPLLKQHLLRTLAMTNEELASLEPIIAEAWDRWDHQRRLHYAEHVAKNGGPPPGMPPPPYAPRDLTQHDPNAHPFPHPNGPGPADPSQAQAQLAAQAQAQAQAVANDFRARFHRSIIGPPPFRTGAFEGQGGGSGAGTPGANGTSEAIDPHLANGSSASSTSTSGATKTEP